MVVSIDRVGVWEIISATFESIFDSILCDD